MALDTACNRHVTSVLSDVEEGEILDDTPYVASTMEDNVKQLEETRGRTLR
ncbi:hypothetical protein K7432_016341 [Basidiobolus ranarum]|uniref:Uncharacterized protein n=1 Tax=Basidiobolus ranarum TaxID=34480 RepID=A0ABR2WEX4_9FUNG